MKTYTVVLSPEPDSDWYSVSCPAMPGAVSQGHGREDALRNTQESMTGSYEVGLENGVTPLEESPALVAEHIEFILSWKAEEGWPLVVETAPLSIGQAVAA